MIPPIRIKSASEPCFSASMGELPFKLLDVGARRAKKLKTHQHKARTKPKRCVAADGSASPTI
jgi:hypothetical protein